MTKTHITRPRKLKYLGFGFYKDSKAKEWKCRPHQDSVMKFKGKLKEIVSIVFRKFNFCRSADGS